MGVIFRFLYAKMVAMKHSKQHDGTQDPAFYASAPSVDPQAGQLSSQPTRRSGSAVVAWGFVVLLLIGMGFMALLGFEPLKQKLHVTQAMLNEANRSVASLQHQVAQLENNQNLLERQREGLEHQVQSKSADVAAIEAVAEQLQKSFQFQIDHGDLWIRPQEGTLTIDVVNDVLFESNRAILTGKGGRLVKQIAQILREYVPGKILEVGGHTDSQPLALNLARHFPSNWELSCAQASEVVRFIQEQVHFPADHLVAAGYAGTRPIADNRHAPGRRRNRRIELVVKDLGEQHATVGSTPLDANK